jgi:hypothetical protein
MAATSVAEPPPQSPSDILGYLMGDHQKVTIAMQAIVDKLSKADSSKVLCSEEQVFMSNLFIHEDDRGNIHKDYNFAGHIYEETWLDAYNKEIERLKGHPAYFKSMNYPDSKNDILNRDLNYFLGRNDIAISKIKHYLPLCPHNLIFIPLNLLNLSGSKMPPDISDHQNGILISKKDSKVLRIEPAYSPELSTEEYERRQEAINDGIINIVKAVGIENPVIVSINHTCPQAVTRDINCVFWTLFICQEIMRSEHGLDNPNEIIRFYSSKPRGELATIIQEFKAKLIREIIPEYLRESGDSWPELEKFNIDFPGYNGAGKRRRKTRKRKPRRRKSKKRL